MALDLDNLKKEAEALIASASSLSALEAARVELLGKKGQRREAGGR